MTMTKSKLILGFLTMSVSFGAFAKHKTKTHSHSNVTALNETNLGQSSSTVSSQNSGSSSNPFQQIQAPFEVMTSAGYVSESVSGSANGFDVEAKVLKPIFSFYNSVDIIVGGGLNYTRTVDTISWSAGSESINYDYTFNSLDLILNGGVVYNKINRLKIYGLVNLGHSLYSAAALSLGENKNELFHQSFNYERGTVFGLNLTSTYNIRNNFDAGLSLNLNSYGGGYHGTSINLSAIYNI